MAAATILHVGDDNCHRIPVMERSGLLVIRSRCSVHSVRACVGQNAVFSAVTFHNDLRPPEEPVVLTARELCHAPLVLFKNPAVDCEEELFDLVITVPTSPEVWSKTLREAIADVRRVQEFSRQLRHDSEAVRKFTQELREASERHCVSPVDYDVLFRGGSGDSKH